MSIINNLIIKSTINYQTLVIIGEKLRIEELNILIELKNKDSNVNKKLYFINPSQDIINLLKNVLLDEEFQILSSIREIKEDIIKYNLIVSGIDILSKDFEILKKQKKYSKKILLFTEKIADIFKRSFEIGNPHIKFIEQSMSDFLNQFITKEVLASTELSQENYISLIDRGEAKDLYRKFAADKTKKACLITGMFGIGKSAFINELRQNYGLNSNYFEIELTDRYNTLIDTILVPLSEMFGLKTTEKEYRSAKISQKNIDIVIENLIKKFDTFDNASLVFRNIDDIYNIKDKKFYKNEINLFFKYLILRKSFKSNKIFFVSNKQIDFHYDIYSFISIINLKEIDPYNTKLIMSREYSNRNNPEFAEAIMNVSDEKIDSMICGHPELAKRFVAVSLKYGITSLINDPIYQKEYEQEVKIKYLNDELLKKIPLDEGMNKILEYLVLFKSKIDLSFFEKLKTDISPKIISLLEEMFMIQGTTLKSGVKEFYVPALIKSYFISKMSKSKYQDYNTKLGDFFWWKAEKEVQTPEIQKAQSNAIYHFSQAENKEKEKQIILRFKDLFLEKALLLYNEKNYTEAYSYFYDLFSKKELSNKSHINFLLKSAIHSKQNTIGEIYKYGINEYPTDEFIKTTYANHCLRSGDIEKAEEVCLEILDDTPQNYGINNFYANILFEKGEYDNTFELLEKWIKFFQDKQNRSENDKKQLHKFNQTKKELVKKHKSLETVKKANQEKGKLGNLQGAFLERIIKSLLEKVYPNRDVTIKHSVDIKGTEFDFVIIDPNNRETIVIEVKGYNNNTFIPLIKYNTEGTKQKQGTIKWFFEKQKEFFRNNYTNIDGYGLKFCFITTGKLTEDAIDYLDGIKDSKLKPSNLELYYSGENFIKLLTEYGMKNDITDVKKHYFK